MRVITGVAKGKKLLTLDGKDVRPTTDRIKEAIFSVIHFYLSDKIFLDLFAGSGQMGIEALSRGAVKSIFVDEDKKSINIIQNNLRSTNLYKNADVFNMKSETFLKSFYDKVDIAFLDPPYNMGILQNVIEKITPKINEGGMIICESSLNEKLPEEINNFVTQKVYEYSKIKITFYAHKDVIS